MRLWNKKEGILICIFYLIFSTSMHESSQKYLPQHHSGSLEGLQAAGCRSCSSGGVGRRQQSGKRDRKDRFKKLTEDRGGKGRKSKCRKEQMLMKKGREFQCSQAMATIGSHGTLRFLKMLRSEIKQLAAVLQL